VTLRDKDFDEYELLSYKGYLVSLRSWAYFNVVRLFGEAVYIDDNFESYSPQTNFKKYNRTTMIDTLINQLKKYAKDQEEYINTWRINKHALLAEMYIETDQYDSAWFYAKGAIDLYGRSSDYYKIDDQFSEENWKNIFIGASDNQYEVLSAVPFSMEDNQYNLLVEYFNYVYYIKPSTIITGLFEEQKPTGDVWRGLGVSYDTLNDKNTTMISKYLLEIGYFYSSDIIITRASDLHLIMAEALNRMGETNTVLMILNRGFKNTGGEKPKGYTGWITSNIGIRGRVALQQIPEPEGDENTIMLALEDYIIQERAMEMAFEGKRWFDLVRIARRRNDPAYLANKVAAKFTDNAKADAIRTKLMNPANWYLPKDF